jgi:hypothetical protein
MYHDTQDEIAEAVNMERSVITRRMEELCNLEKLPKSTKLSALYEDEFEIPIYQYSEWQFLIFTLMYYSQDRIDGTS